MKKVAVVLILGVVAVCAQQTRREVVNPAATPAEDARANSDKVPDGYAIHARFERVAILRFKYDTDLLAGIEKLVKQEKIRNAVILSALGSVRNYHVHQVSNRTFPVKDTFVKDPTAPADILGMNGYIIDGRVHAHITLANPERAFGGHLESGTNVFTFAVITLGVLDPAADLSRADDKTNR